jgi:outer membrane protein
MHRLRHLATAAALVVLGGAYRMGLRHALLASFSLLVFAASAEAETAQPPSSTPPLSGAPEAKSTKVAQAQPPAQTPATARPRAPKAGPVMPAEFVPHTLIEALAATYSNQPALQAERAKLRATDENVPTALAGWRPTVVLAGTTGYGDGKSAAFRGVIGGFLTAQTDRLIGTAQATVTQNIYTGRSRPTSTVLRIR